MLAQIYVLVIKTQKFEALKETQFTVNVFFYILPKKINYFLLKTTYIGLRGTSHVRELSTAISKTK